MRVLKYLLIFVVLVLVVGVGAVFLLPRDQIVALAAAQVKAQTGRDLVIEGTPGLTIWPSVGVTTGPVRLSNAEWASTPDMVRAEGAEISVDLLGLMSGTVAIQTLRLLDPVIALEVGAEGQQNWVFDAPDASGPSGATETGTAETATAGTSPAGDGASDEGTRGPAIALPEAVIENGTVIYRDAQAGSEHRIEAITLTAGMDSLVDPLRVDGTVTWNEEATTFGIRIARPEAAVTGGTTDVSVSAENAYGAMSVVGALDLSADIPAFEGTITKTSEQPGALIAWASGGTAPDGLGPIDAVLVLTANDAELDADLTGTMTLNGVAMSLDLAAADGAGWMAAPAPTLSGSVAAPGLFSATLSGEVSTDTVPQFDGPFSITLTDVRAVAEQLGGAVLDAPAGTLETAAASGQLVASAARIGLSGAMLSLDDNAFAGDLAVSLDGVRPRIAGQLNSDGLDLSAFLKEEANSTAGDGGGGAAPASATAGWSTEPIDLAALGHVDAQIAISSRAIDLGTTALGQTDIAVALEDGAMTVTLDRVAAFGGGIAGTLSVADRNGVRLATDLTVEALQLRPVLATFAGIDMLEGLGALQLTVAGQGASLDALMRSLSGEGAVDLRDGAVIGIDVANIVRNLASGQLGEGRTDFSSITASFGIAGGVLSTEDFAFFGPLVRVLGAGTVNLGAQSQSLRVEPKAVSSLTGQAGSVSDPGLQVFPIIVGGTWSAPTFTPDLAAGIRGLIAEPGAALDSVQGLIDGSGKIDTNAAIGAALNALTGGAGAQGTDDTSDAQPTSKTTDPAAAIGGLLKQFGN